MATDSALFLLLAAFACLLALNALWRFARRAAPKGKAAEGAIGAEVKLAAPTTTPLAAPSLAEALKQKEAAKSKEDAYVRRVQRDQYAAILKSVGTDDAEDAPAAPEDAAPAEATSRAMTDAPTAAMTSWAASLMRRPSTPTAGVSIEGDEADDEADNEAASGRAATPTRARSTLQRVRSLGGSAGSGSFKKEKGVRPASPATVSGKIQRARNEKQRLSTDSSDSNEGGGSDASNALTHQGGNRSVETSPPIEASAGDSRAVEASTEAAQGGKRSAEPSIEASLRSSEDALEAARRSLYADDAPQAAQAQGKRSIVLRESEDALETARRSLFSADDASEDGSARKRTSALQSMRLPFRSSKSRASLST